MNSITVEGFIVNIQRTGNKFVITVPDLPGVVGQVDKESQARSEIGRLIRAHLEELARQKPLIRRNRGNDQKPRRQRLNRP